MLERGWFTLFFLPIFPISPANRRLICGTCNSTQQINPATLANAQVGSVEPSIPVSALFSIVLGIISIPLIAACFTSLLTSIAAIVCGHFALASYAKSVAKPGKPLAMIGLASGYVALLLTIVAFCIFINLDFDAQRAAPNSPSEMANAERMHEAEMRIISRAGGPVGMGNSELAAEIANEFAARLKKLSDATFTGGKDRVLDLTDGEFLTFCEMHEDRCVFLVHVPQYKDYKGEVREQLSTLAWATAVATTSKHLDAGDRLAVGMRGTLLYGDILVGSHPGYQDAEVADGGTKDDLYAFFLPPQIATEATRDSVVDEPQLNKNPEYADDANMQESLAQQPVAKADEKAEDDPFKSLPSLPSARPPRVKPEIESPATAALPDASATKDQATPAVEKAPEALFANQIQVRELATIEARGWTVYSLAFANQDRWLIAGRMDGEVLVFDCESGESLFSTKLENLNGIESLAVSDAHNSVLVGGTRGVTGVLELRDNADLTNFRELYRHDGAVRIQASPSFPFVISGGKNGTLAWQPFQSQNTTSPRIQQSLKKPVLGLRLPRSGEFATATDGEALIEFSLRSGKVKKRLELTSSYAHAADVSLDRKYVAVSVGSEVVEFDANTGEEIRSYKERGTGIHWSVGYHPTQPWLLTGGRGVIHVWDRNTGTKLAEVDVGRVQYIKTFVFGAKNPAKLAAIPASAGQAIHLFELHE